jgi:fluoride exporter
MTLLMVVIGAAIGAPARYLTDRAIQLRHESAFPWGTLIVNVIACAILGAVTGAAVESAASPDVRALIGTGFCGALSTYSTFSFEVMRLREEGERSYAVAYVVVSIAAGLGAAFLGAGVAHLIWA